MNIFCISVITGKEQSFKDEVQIKLDSNEFGFCGKIYVFKKLMRLKNGKIYDEILFPGYVFLSCDTEEKQKLMLLRSVEGFIRYLPNLANICNLQGSDLEIVQELITSGNVQRFLRVNIDENDKVVVTSKYFNNANAIVKSVNRRNHRLNLQVQLMNGISVINLSYFDVEKEDWSAEEDKYIEENNL